MVGWVLVLFSCLAWFDLGLGDIVGLVLFETLLSAMLAWNNPLLSSLAKDNLKLLTLLFSTSPGLGLQVYAIPPGSARL